MPEKIGCLEVGGFKFPDLQSPFCHIAAGRWEPHIVHRALHTKILVAATTRIEGAWAAYVFPVAGRDHATEVSAWNTDGVRIEEPVARALFPQFKSLPYAG